MCRVPKENEGSAGDPVAPWTRVAILLAALTVAAVLSKKLTGSIVPTKPGQSIVFQSSLLLIVLGSAVLEHKFTRPADSVVNAVTGIVALMTVYEVAPRVSWWLVFVYCALVFGLALTCTVVSTGPEITGWRKRVADLTYPPAVYLGRSRVLHSVVFLFGVFAFYKTTSREAAILVVFWGVFVSLWPLGLPQLLSLMGRRHPATAPLGRVIRREWPDLVRVELQSGVAWSADAPRLYQDADGVQHLVVPLYKQLRDQQGLATGLCVRYAGQRQNGLQPGYVYGFVGPDLPTRDAIAESLGASLGSELVGFVIEESMIGAIRFETWRPDVCNDGLLVSCLVAGTRVFYQITEGLTREESLESDRLGSQVAVAVQVGTYTAAGGFVKRTWVPTMNTPVFAERPDFGADIQVPDSDFIYGRVPGTELRVSGPFASTLDFHTAVLGVTGSGKTELAFDLIRHCAAQGVKVVCIDLTARYERSLKDLDPQNLSISTEVASELGAKLFEVETGDYGAGKEKKALYSFSGELRKEVAAKIESFLTSDQANAQVGLITLSEISNTKATLYITELYMSCLLNYARDHPEDCPRTLVVVEEAHTVMPETSSMGLGDYDSRGLVSKISQIALQGRKYGVGLLVIAQRTATVTKNVLTQCNTLVALSSFDETTTGFLSSVFGRSHAEVLKDLPRLHAVVYGKGVRSERPIIVEIPYNPAKDPEGELAGRAGASDEPVAERRRLEEDARPLPDAGQPT